MTPELIALEAFLNCAEHAVSRAHAQAVNLHDTDLQNRLAQVIGEVHAMKLDAITARAAAR